MKGAGIVGSNNKHMLNKMNFRALSTFSYLERHISLFQENCHKDLFSWAQSYNIYFVYGFNEQLKKNPPQILDLLLFLCVDFINKYIDQCTLIITSQTLIIMQKTAQAKALLSILTSLKCNEISCYNKLSVENFNCVIFCICI